MKSKVRASITFSPGLLEKIDNEADELGMNRSAFVAMAVNSYFREKRMMKNLPNMLSSMQSVLGNLDSVMDKAERMKESGMSEEIESQLRDVKEKLKVEKV